MKKTPGTPGPWSVVGNTVYLDPPQPRERGKKHDPYPEPHRYWTLPGDAATAHLISAAPDLYEALEIVLASASPRPDLHPKMCVAWECARAALAKARGESGKHDAGGG